MTIGSSARPEGGDLAVAAAAEQWPLQGEFRIARGVKQAAEVVVVTVSDGAHTGMGECVPYRRYDETVASVLAQLEPIRRLPQSHALDYECANRVLDAGAARNALDCALWDWRARKLGRSVWALLDLPEPRPVTTAYTIGIASPDSMGKAARANRARPLLKVKLGGVDAARDGERLRAVRAGAGDAELIVDANEGWSRDRLLAMLPVAEAVGVTLIEQPLPAGQDQALLQIDTPVSIGADESVHTADGLAALRGKYQVVNIKLDKTGGLTSGLATLRAARSLGFEIMVGCMVATSLSMAPAMLLAGSARFVDLDGPLLLAHDREPGLLYRDSVIGWPDTRVWGQGQPAHDRADSLRRT